MRWTLSLLFVFTFTIGTAAEVDRMKPGAPNPADAIKTFELPEGFVIELVAAEPLVMDPVAFAWGPDGKLWVVEMADYNHLPTNDPDPKKPRGRVVYLTDSNGDGTYDKRHVFLDDLNYPNGVMPWRDGVLITSAPDILFASDTTPNDDNFIADKREVLYTGFAEGNPQLRINGLAWGLDNWIYCANGLSHGKVKSVKTGKVIDIRGRDVRIRPDTGEIEHATGPSQFGRVRDDYGNWFGVNNSDLIRHYVLPDHYLRRNPHVKYPDPVVSLVTPRNPPLFARGERVDRFHAPYMAGRFTSACGLHIYRDTLLDSGDDIYYHNAFVCEPVHNLITRRVLTPDGVTFKATRAKGEEQREWLTSTDNWFRPAMVRTGPDGAIWIADMYRAVIEHTQWAPKEVHKLFALRHGHDRGRIYRVYRKANVDDATEKRLAILTRKPAMNRRFDQMKDEDVVPFVVDRNGYVRDLASIELIKRHWPLTNKTVEQETVARLLRALVDEDVYMNLGYLHQMLKFPDRDAPRQMTQKDFDTIRASMKWGFDVPSAIPITCELGNDSTEYAGRLLVETLRLKAENPYIVAAVMSSAIPHLQTITEDVFGDKPTLFSEKLLADLASLVLAEKHESATLSVLIATTKPNKMGYATWQYAVLATMLDHYANQGKSLRHLATDSKAPQKHSWQRATKMVVHVSDKKQFDALPARKQKFAVELLGRLPSNDTSGHVLLASLLEPTSPSHLQQGALDAIARHGDTAINGLLLDADRWKTFTPALRSRIVSMLMQRSSRIALLLNAVESGTVQQVEIDAAARQQLIASKTATIRDRAKKLLGQRQTDRTKLVAQFADVATMKGDTARGRTLYDKTCAVCHRLAGEGKGVAPDLSSLSDRSTKFMLENILDPNAAVDSRYINYVCETEQGDTLTGMLVSETGGSLTLVSANGDKHVILRKDVVSLRSTNLSLMPEGLEQQLGKPGESKQALADVIAYVQYRSQPARPLAGVKDRVYSPGTDGSLSLTCRSVAAFGISVNYEREDNNIGNWTSEGDYLVWQINTQQAGKYEVWFDYAVEDAWKGNKISLSARNEGGEMGRIEAAVKSTGSQDRYEQHKFGVIQLAAGKHTLTLRAAGKINGELMDLRGVRLVPVR